MTNNDATDVFRCANPRCSLPLRRDHTTLVTTAHVRRFCDVDCVVEGHKATIERILAGDYP